MPTKYRPWNTPAHSILDYMEVPDDFDRNDYKKPYDKVECVQVLKNGTRNPWPMAHRVVAECLGREQIGGVGEWKRLPETEQTK